MDEVGTRAALIVDPDADTDGEPDTYEDGVKIDVVGIDDDKKDPGYKVKWIFRHGDS